jgi:hypothetical protein
MALPEDHIPHPSGGSYHPDHIQTPKEMPSPVVKKIAAPAPVLEPTPSGGEAYANVLPVGEVVSEKPEIPGLVVPLERPLGSPKFVVPKSAVEELPDAVIEEIVAPAEEAAPAQAEPSKRHVIGQD